MRVIGPRSPRSATAAVPPSAPPTRASASPYSSAPPCWTRAARRASTSSPSPEPAWASPREAAAARDARASGPSSIARQRERWRGGSPSASTRRAASGKVSSTRCRATIRPSTSATHRGSPPAWGRNASRASRIVPFPVMKSSGRRPSRTSANQRNSSSSPPTDLGRAVLAEPGDGPQELGPLVAPHPRVVEPGGPDPVEVLAGGGMLAEPVGHPTPVGGVGPTDHLGEPVRRPPARPGCRTPGRPAPPAVDRRSRGARADAGRSRGPRRGSGPRCRTGHAATRGPTRPDRWPGASSARSGRPAAPPAGRARRRPSRRRPAPSARARPPPAIGGRPRRGAGPTARVRPP